MGQKAGDTGKAALATEEGLSEAAVEIGARIRDTRFRARMSQQTLVNNVRGRRVQMSRFILSRIETGDQLPTLEQLWYIADELKVHVRDLGATEETYASLAAYADEAMLKRIRCSLTERPKRRIRAAQVKQRALWPASVG